MEINIKMDKCRFFVDEEKRTVVCVIENTRNLVYNFFNLSHWLDDIDPSSHVMISPRQELSKHMTLPDRFTGKAVCAPEDEWNEEVGRLIAFDRAKEKLATSFFKRAQEYVTEIDVAFNNMVTRVNEYGARLENGMKRRREHIKRLAPDYEVSNENQSVDNA